ncbi:MAG: hypothetical protein HY319_04695 [Armatimonadetes bacterium]|nr:hypothetical protein [Armatimonadota bacterium]
MPSDAETELSPSAAAELEESGPPDFKPMSSQQQYEYLQTVVESQDGSWKDEPGEVNLIGVRNFQDGEPTEPQGDVYNDTIYAAWRDDDGEYHVRAFQASTDAGVVANPESTGFGYSDSEGYVGLSHLADGTYQDAWVRGGVPGSDLGLRQAGDVRIQADANNDGIIQADERLGPDGSGTTVGASWGIQFHPGGSRDRAVDTWSAGCQVIVAEEYADFQAIIRNATNERFSYTLVDSSNLPPVSGAYAARPDAAASPAGQPETAAGAPAASAVAEPGGQPAGAPVAQPGAPVARPEAAPAAQAGAAAIAQPEAAPVAQNPNQPAAAPNPVQSAAPGPRPADEVPVPAELAREVENRLPGFAVPESFELLVWQLMMMLGPPAAPWGKGGAWAMAQSLEMQGLLQRVLGQAAGMNVAFSPELQGAIENLGLPQTIDGRL